MPSFAIPLSGLEANATALDVIANNLANLNTNGYKASRASFTDLFYQQIGSSGSGDPSQIGVGGTVGSIATIATQGSIERTGIATDVAVQGEGLFVLDRGGTRQYTRSGNFTLDSAGTLIASDGSQVLGFPAVAGVLTTNQTLSPLAIATGQVNPPNATTNVEVDLNLDADSADGTTFQTTVAVHDALGGSHLLTFNMTKSATNSWDYDITIPAEDLGGTGAPVSLNTGTLDFDGTGQLTSPAADVSGIVVSGFANGASDLDFTWQLLDSAGNGIVSQLSSPSAVASTRQDGFASGSLQNFSIRNDGIIEGVFSNGQTMPIGQLALATFPNLQGLLRNGGNNFLGTLASGAPSVGVAGTGGRGLLSGGALENSNVDIATEFAQMIVAQRGFQANSRAITTFDEVTQEAINLIR